MKTLRTLLLLSIGSPLAYIGSYLLVVEAYVEKAVGASLKPVPQYLVGGKLAEKIYAPVQKLDALVRAKYWQER